MFIKKVHFSLLPIFPFQAMYHQSTPNERRSRQLQKLLIEDSILSLDFKIMKCMQNAHHDTRKCNDILKKYQNQPITAFMLKKHPHLVDTIKRMRSYVGRLNEWSLTDGWMDADEFRENAAQIRESAVRLYQKFEQLFTFPVEYSFASTFSNEVERFRRYCEHKQITGEQLTTLTIDPMVSKRYPEMSSVELVASFNDSDCVQNRRYLSAEQLHMELNLDIEIRLLENQYKGLTNLIRERQLNVGTLEYDLHVLCDEQLHCVMKLYQKWRQRNRLMVSAGSDKNFK